MDYEKGLNQLKQHALGKNWVGEFEIYESRLRDNLQSERLYGTTEQIRSDRARIIASLNHLTQEQSGLSFNDLCLNAALPVQTYSATSGQMQGTNVIRPPHSVFISYSHHDERYLHELRTHLAHYVRTGVVQYWDDTKVLPGAKWQEERQNALRNAKIAILLLSADFLNSDIIMLQEVPALLAAAEHQQTTIFCLILRPCLFEDTTLAQFKPLNDPATPLSGMSYGKRENFWVEVARLIKDRLQIHD